MVTETESRIQKNTKIFHTVDPVDNGISAFNYKICPLKTPMCPKQNALCLPDMQGEAVVNKPCFALSYSTGRGKTGKTDAPIENELNII